MLSNSCNRSQPKIKNLNYVHNQDMDARKNSSPLLIPGTVKVSNPYVFLYKEKSGYKKHYNIKGKDEILTNVKEKLMNMAKTTTAKETTTRDPRNKCFLKKK
jgi:hypothetical protein